MLTVASQRQQLKTANASLAPTRATSMTEWNPNAMAGVASRLMWDDYLRLGSKGPQLGVGSGFSHEPAVSADFEDSCPPACLLERCVWVRIASHTTIVAAD